LVVGGQSYLELEGAKQEETVDESAHEKNNRKFIPERNVSDGRSRQERQLKATRLPLINFFPRRRKLGNVIFVSSTSVKVCLMYRSQL
jgi:hypothetical protein